MDEKEILSIPVVEVKNLKKSYKVYIPRSGVRGRIKDFFKRQYKIIEAVKGVNLCIHQGEIVGYIGLNGAGKSTTIKMITGIMKPTDGIVRICGINPYNNRRKISKDISVIFGQKTHLWADLPVGDSFELIKEMYDIPEQQYNERITWLNKQLDLDSVWKQQVRRLSLGQKMLCEIALGLIYNPKILFLDEPTIGLDVLVKNKVISLIQEMNKVYKTTVIVTSHDLKDIERLCNRIIMIDKGNIVYDGMLHHFYRQYGDGSSKVAFYAESELEIEDFHSILSKYKAKVNSNELLIEYDDRVESVTNIIENVLVCSDAFYDMSIKKGDLEEIVERIYTGGKNEI